MPVFRLTEKLVFPPVDLSTKEGIIAIEGDLSPERLLLAYSSGIFPWYNDDEPIIWWSPDPRFVLFPEKIRISDSLRKEIRRNKFEITYDRDFEDVIKGCSNSPRKNQNGTWITSEMIDAYIGLHRLGFAHSVEARVNGEIVGGLYGVSLGRCFMGESMFTKVPNASKVAFATLVADLIKKNFAIIDSQVYTDHLSNFGAENIPRKEYLKYLDKALDFQTLRGDWGTVLKN
jgi:leucyl/phenylalanyl-tRNA---protein transferase